MTKKVYYFKKDKLPTGFSPAIITRFMDEKRLGEFWKEYQAARKTDRMTMEPTKLHYKLASDAKKLGKKEAAKINKIGEDKVYYAIRRVAVWEFLKD